MKRECVFINKIKRHDDMWELTCQNKRVFIRYSDDLHRSCQCWRAGLGHFIHMILGWFGITPKRYIKVKRWIFGGPAICYCDERIAALDAVWWRFVAWCRKLFEKLLRKCKRPIDTRT
jgi:hypothetical protein